MTFPNLRIQPVTPADLAAVVELDRQCLGGMWGLESYRREIESPNSELWVLSPALDDPQTPALIGLGCFWAILEEAHITLLMIHPDYHRQGLGQLLLWQLLAQAARRGQARATLEVRASNEGAIALYEKFGFQRIGRRKGYYPETGEDALIFWLQGLHQPEFALKLDLWKAQVTQHLTHHGWQLSPFAALIPPPFST
ncbi:ribosomal protein S18-alanine N-acetyltransferase [Spirulina sp. CCNP1310]|uniref:ribosomal protein S18-alanine N-acetyltransferase n=1 Tax=Spirulina sp. CCNP1310 TaxID=3110249 RepID=UPI002B205F4B|nr:ribosomal protein S18-alanine N-acetyltransferase [Spirulina sp. CCNP1310]MEA5420226.1 ribosomal protein S18-alanine N-acetyltransferase [Spirulina sp. CCNP1310]